MTELPDVASRSRSQGFLTGVAIVAAAFAVASLIYVLRLTDPFGGSRINELRIYWLAFILGSTAGILLIVACSLSWLRVRSRRVVAAVDGPGPSIRFILGLAGVVELAVITAAGLAVLSGYKPAPIPLPDQGAFKWDDSNGVDPATRFALCPGAYDAQPGYEPFDVDGETVYAASNPLITARDLTRVTGSIDGSGYASLELSLNDSAASTLLRWTSNNSGELLVIFLDDKPYAAPKVLGSLSKTMQLSGVWNVDEVKQIVKRIRGES